MTLNLNVFISSPGDVSDERALAKEVIERLGRERAHRKRLRLEIIAWDVPGAGTAMSAHLEPQDAINRGMKRPSECDIVIVILWARMGTPLSETYLKPDGSRYRSGTEYEYLDALTAAKDKGTPVVLVYRKKDAPYITLSNPVFEEKRKQWNQVGAFFAEFRNQDGSFRSYFKEYETATEFKEALDVDLRDIVAQRLKPNQSQEEHPSLAEEEPIWKKSPYPGLRAFTSDEAEIFFGRSRETDGLIAKLRDPRNRFIAVIGASGSGKSSLVAAGLLPRLQKGAIEGTEDWVGIRFTPGESGDNPFMALAVGLKPELDKHGWRTGDATKGLMETSETLSKLAQLVLEDRPQWAKLLLFIDQFEELFTSSVTEEYRDPFVKLLYEATSMDRISVVATMRADFVRHCLDWPKLTELLNEGSYLLSTPGPNGLYDMITKPAQQAGLRFEDRLVKNKRLVDRIIDDAGTEPGTLPLMAFALSQLYAHRTEDNSLTHDAYDKLKGVKGAIGQRAENILSQLKPEVQAKLSDVFRELVAVSEDGVATRRRAPLDNVTESPAAEKFVNDLVKGRLLTTTSGKGDEPVVEVAHEALLTHWPRLADWIKDSGENLRQLRQMQNAAAEWDRKGRLDHYLWPGDRILEVVGAIKRLRISFENLNAVEQLFLGGADREVLLYELDDHSTTHERRAAIGDRLAKIGDPRSGVGLNEEGVPEIEWVAVPGGHVELYANNGAFDVEEFRIARYPVTYRQYRAFVEANDGYPDEQWWQALKHEPAPGPQRLPVDNHPAEKVSWYDAVAFCRWLSERLGYEVRLPTEWEWQQAATGGDPNNIFPWGHKWDDGRANTRESGLSQTTAVGLYPRGRTAQGVLDMAGNVWEWCLNKTGKSKETAPDESNDWRVLRGGSWLNELSPARTDFRRRGRPYYRNDYSGFRVCCAAPTY